MPCEFRLIKSQLSQPQEGQAQGWSSGMAGGRCSKASGRLPSCFRCVCVMRTPHGGNVAADNSRVHTASQILGLYDSVPLLAQR